MKLKNKRTGEIGDIAQTSNNAIIVYYPIVDGVAINPQHRAIYESLAELNEEWEDYEEPKPWWYIDITLDVKQGALFLSNYVEEFKTVGNYFETREEAEKVVEKLKAWHKLMDYWQTEVLGWEIRDMPTGGNWQTVNVKFNVKTRKEPMELLDLLFGGEE